MWKLQSILTTILVNLFLTLNSGVDATVVIKAIDATQIGIETVITGIPKKCAINERFEPCPENRCLPQICEHVGIPQCSSHEEKYFHGKEEIYEYIGYNEVCGPPACICIDNYVRNNEGVCIPTTLCPSCGYDKNATSGCGINCGRRCSNYNKKSVECAKECYVNSCDCKKDYVFDDFTGFCVLPKDCSNKNAPDPEGADGSTNTGNGNSTEGVSNDDPCSLCSEDNCDVEDMMDNKLDGGESCENYIEECSNKDVTTKATSRNNSETSTTPKAEILSTSSTKTSEETSQSLTTPTMTNKPDTTKNTDNITTTNEPDTSKMANPETPRTTNTTDPTTTTGKLYTTTTEKPYSTTKKDDSWLEFIKDKLSYKTDGPYTEELTTIAEKKDPTSERSVTTQSTTKSPKDCKGKNELYECASCPQLSCVEYLNGTRCPVKTKPSKECEPECRCRAGYYRDWEDNCITVWDCRRLARSTSAMVSSTTTTKKPKERTSTEKPTTPEQNCEDEALKLFIKGNFAYSVNILQELSLSRPGTNVLCAGSSILSMTSALALMATGDTKKQLLNVPNFIDTDQIRCFFPKFIANLTAEHRYIKYKFLRNIYVDEVCQVSDNFKTNTEKIFSFVPENIDFTSPESAQQISETIAQQTNNQIENFISTETLAASPKSILLLDAQSFKGQWEKPFDPADTIDRDFFWNGKVLKRPTMYVKGTFLYTESLPGTKILTLKFKKGRLSEDYYLVIILPNSIDGHKDLMKKLTNPNVLLSALDKQRLENVEIYLPKIKVTVANKLKIATEKAKMDLIFNNKSSGLTDIADCEAPVVSQILQRCVIELNESGDGKVTDFESEDDAQQKKNQRTYLFKADRPFYYAVMLNRIVLLAGIFFR